MMTKRFPELADLPLMFHTDASGGWHIRAGISKFLVAEGSCYSASIGRALIKTLARAPYRAIRQPRHVSFSAEEYTG
jgi:hypothetical protein